MIQLGLQRKRISILYVAIAVLITGAAYSTYAQLSSQAYTVETVNVFPSTVIAEGFDNAETLTFQNLDEYALLQDFNAINSATLDRSYVTLLEEAQVAEEIEVEIARQLGTDTNEAELEIIPVSSATSTATSSVETDEIPETTEDESVTTEEVEVIERIEQPENEEAEVQFDFVEPEVEIELGTTTVLRAVDHLFVLAVETLTETFSSTSATSTLQQPEEVSVDTISPEPSAAEEVEDVVITETTVDEPREVFGFATATASTAAAVSPELSDVPAIEAVSTSTEVSSNDTIEIVDSVDEAANAEDNSDDAENNESTASSTTPANTGSTISTDTCEPNCSGHVLQLNNFGYPLDEGVQLSGAQLRMSFAAKKKESQSIDPSFTINYSLDEGQTWSTGGSILIDQEVSNSVNGGYYLFALPAITDQQTLDNLQVELRYDDAADLVEELFVESVWLELFVLEPPEDEIETPMADLLADDGFQDTKLSGDVLQIGPDDSVEFTFTDENRDETLIIKADQKTYSGLSEATTFFSVTNTSDQADEFTVQTYFPREIGEVTNLQVYEVNKPRQAMIPEYRPYVFHCEAGWQAGSAGVLGQSLAELSIAGASTTASTFVSTTTNATTSTSSVATSSDSLQSDTFTASTTASTSTDAVVGNEGEFSCRDTSVVRTCDSLEGEGTACIVSEKVQDHEMTVYSPGWSTVATGEGTLGAGGLVGRIGSFLGFGPERKDVPDQFVGEVYTDDSFAIAPGETRYFKMDIAFPPFSNGEYWIEAIGNREYGLLDPFWSSDWTYRMPLEIENPTASAQTEFQVQLQLDSAMSDFWANVDSAGDDIRFVQEVVVGNFFDETAPRFENAYDPAWNGRVALTVDADNINSRLDNYPLYVNLADLGPDFWSGVQSDGRDIRVTQGDGASELPYDLVEIDTVAQTGELHFLADSIDSTTDTTFHIYYDNPGASTYAAGDTYGSHAVWQAYEAVYHFSDDPTTIGNTIVDASGNGKDLIVENDALATTTGKLGTAIDLTVSGTGILRNADWQLVAGDEHVSSGWYQQTDNSSEAVWQWGTGAQPERTEYMPWFNGGTVTGRGYFRFGDLPNTVWDRTAYVDRWVHFTTVTGDDIGDPHLLYDDNILRIDTVQDRDDPFNNDANGLQVGRYTTGGSYDGFIDELRFEFDDSRRTPAWINAEYINQSTSTDFYATSTQLAGGAESFGWYDTGWNQRVAFDIAPYVVDGTQTDFPVYVDLSLFDADFFAGVLSNGADIRVTEGDGKTELPIELVDIDTGAGTGQLYFKSTISGGETFYVYFDNEEAVAYDRDDVYGSENVWTNGFQAVYHMSETAAGIGNPNVYLDSTSNEYHGDDENASDGKNGLFGAGQEFGDTQADRLSLPNDVLDGLTTLSTSWWHQTANTGQQAILSAAKDNTGAGANEYILWFTSDTNFQIYVDGAGESFGLSDTIVTHNTGDWNHFVSTADAAAVGSEVNFYVNGQPDTENPDAQPFTAIEVANGGLVVGQEQDSLGAGFSATQNFEGDLDELRFANVVRDESWIATEYQNMSDNASFIATSSIEVLQPTEFVELDYWLYDWDFGDEEATVWLQVQDLPVGNATVYMYYGSASAPAASDEFAPFTYDTPQDIYYVVEGDNTAGIDIISYVDGNQVSVGGAGTTTIDAGDIATFTGYSQGDAVSVTGPITSKTNDNEGEPVVPISFAGDTFVTPSNRGNPEEWHVFAPFEPATVDVFTDNGGGTAVASAALATGGVDILSSDVVGGDSGVVESSAPILLYAEATANDTFNPYPVTSEDLFGFDSNNWYVSTAALSATYDVYCESGGSAIGSESVARGVQGGNTTCAGSNSAGANSGVRITNQNNPVGVIQEADSDGTESTSFWPEGEFSTQYYIPVNADYVAVLCSPGFPAATVDIYKPGELVAHESLTCTPTATSPDTVRFTDGGDGNDLRYAAGSRVVSTNGVPVFVIFDHTTDDDETNTLGALQGRKYGSDSVAVVAGEQEMANGPTYEQLSFGWYENTDALTPLSAWDLGASELAVEGQNIAGAGAVAEGDVMRLRMNVLGSNATATVETDAYKLQYATAESAQCTGLVDWYDLGEVGSSTALFSGYNNPNVSDGTALSSTTLASSTVFGTYEERNFSNLNQADIAPGEVMEWDWVIEAGNVAVNQSYCFRMVRATGQLFDVYTTYPAVETVGPPNVPTLVTFFDNEKTTQLNPVLTFLTTDIAGDDVNYEIQIDDNADFSSVEVASDSGTNFLDFTNVNNPSEKAPFTSGAPVRFDAGNNLAATTTYYWRVRASDPNGSATSSDWSTAFSYTVDTTLETSQWFQTETDQFITNDLEVVTATGSSITNPAGNGSVTGAPADFDDAVVGNAWGEAFWTDVETSGEILVQVQYKNNGTWLPIPNSEIPDNNLGTTTSPINLLQLDTSVYNELRLVANFTGTGLSLDEWGISWALRIETPILGDLFDNQETADTLPVFDFVSTDPQGDDVEYEVSFSTDQTFQSSSSSFNSSVDAGFVNAVSGVSDTSPFNSAETIAYTTQPGNEFTDGETYWWRARAKDVLPGGNVFSPWSQPDSFTINAATTLSTWSQTTDEQFDQGFLDGTQVAGDSVEISSEIGEFGTIDLIGNTWVLIPTTRTYRNMVVIPSSEFDFSSSAGDGRTTRVRNKTSNSFELKVDNHLNGLSGPTTVDYVVVEAGEWIIDDGGAGVLMLAGTQENVTAKQVSVYSNGVGETITFPTNFGATPPAVFVNIASDNDSDWVDAHVDGGGNRATEVGSASMRIALAVGNHTDSVHAGPEDIDYIAIAPGTGTVDGNGYQSFNTPDGPDGFGGSTYQQPLVGFATAPAVTLVQNNAEDGGQGGFAFKDLQGTNSNTSLALSVAEIGVNADGHTTEVVSVLAFENEDGIISRINDGTLDGDIAGEDIIFSDGNGPKFDNFSWVETTPGASLITYQMQYLVSEDVYALLPDAALPGNSSGFTTSPMDLTSVDVNVYDQIRPFATLQCVTGDCPTIDSWKLEWSEGVNMSGTLQEYDRSTAVTTGTIRAAVNGTPVAATGIVAGGVWTMNNVTAFAGDIVTVWVDGADEADEAVTAFIYDGLGDMTGVSLYEQHLAFDADELGTITNDLLGLYDNSASGDEDIFFEVDGLNNLTVCATGTCADANIYIAEGTSYLPSTSTPATITVHDIVNDGTIQLDSNTVNVDGDWINNATSTTDTSTINMTAVSGTSTITSTESPLDFHTLTFGGFGMATFTVSGPLDLSGDLTVATGTLLRDGLDITVEGSVATEFGGLWQGAGTTTFDGSGATTWTDNNSTPQNIGNVVIDGASTIVTAVTDVAAYDVIIGANDTLVGGSSGNTLYVGGDWTNTGTFNAGDSTVEIVVDDREYPALVPGSSDWYVDTGFVRRMPITINSDEVGGTLENYPFYVDLSTLGSDFWDNVSSDGRDIRITTANGQTELPHDLVVIDAAAQTGELHLLADSVSSTVDTTFYIYYDNAAAVAYDSSATYGSEAVWNDYIAVYHFQDDPTSIGNSITDETGNGKTLQVQAEALATTTGQLGLAYNFASSTNGFLRDSDFTWESGDYLTTSGWYFMEAASNDAYWQFGTAAQPNQVSYRPWYSGTSGLFYFGATGGATYTINPRDTTNWHHFTTLGATSTSDTNRVYEDGILVETLAQTIAGPSNTDVNGLQVGRVGGGGASINAYLDEFRIASTTRSTDWIEAEYTNQFSPAIFYSAGAVDIYDAPTVLDEATHVITGGGSAFHVLRFNDATTSPSFADASVVVNDDFIIATGTVALPTGILTIGGSFLNSGFFMHNNGEIEFTSNQPETLQLQGTNFLNQFNDVTFDGSGTWTFADVNATTTGYMNIEDGAVVFPAGVLTIGDTLDVLSGGATFDNASGTVRFVSAESENIRTAGSSFNNVVFGDGAFGWYSEEWSNRVALTIDAAVPEETLTDYPFYVNLADVPPDFWAHVTSDGRDIRVTTANGETEVPVDVVELDTTTQTGELHFLAPIISDVSSTTYYIYVGNEAALTADPAAPYGRNNVWTGYEAVYHFSEDPVGGITDVTGNGKDLVSAGLGTPATTTGQIGLALDTTTANVLLTDADWEWTAGEDLISSGLYFMDTFDTGALWEFGNSCTTDSCLAFMPWYDNATRGYHRIGETSGNDYNFPRDNSVWHHFTTIGGAADGARVDIYDDNVLRDSYFQTADGANPTLTGLQIGRYTTGTYMDIDIDELRFATTTPTEGWIDYEHRNLRSLGTLYTATSEEFTSAITSFTLNEAVTVAEGDVTLEGARLVAPNDTFFIGGSALNTTGVYDPNNATTTFNSNDLGEAFDFGDVSFWNLSFDGVGGGWTVGTTTVDNNLTLVTGSSYVQAPNTTMSVGGIFSNQFASAATDWTTSTLVLTGGDYTVTDRLDAGDDYAIIQVANDTDIVLWNSTISTSSILDNSSIYMPDFAGIDGQLNIYGDYERLAGDEHWSYATDFDGTDITGNERQANIYLEGGTSVTVATSSTLHMVGVSGVPTTVQSLFGIYSVVLQAGTLNAEFFSMNDAGPLGLELRNGSTITTLQQADFFVAPGRTGITVDASTVNAQPSSNYTTVNFGTSSATTIYKSEWTEQVLLSINASSTGQTITDFPVYVDLSVLGPDFWAGVRSDGADIRITTDLGREVPIDMVEIDSVAQTGELHFLAPKVNATQDTTFYIHYNNPSATAYAVNDVFGSAAVWADYEAVYHFNEDPAVGITDASGNGRNLMTAIGIAATTTGQIGTAVDTTALNVMLSDSDWTWPAGDNLVSSGLYFMANTDTGALWQFGSGGGSNNGSYLAFMPNYDLTNRGRHFFGVTSGGEYTVSPYDNTIWHHFTTVGRTGFNENNEIYEDNIQQDTVAQRITSINPTNTGLKIGRYQTGTYSEIQIDELRFSTNIPTENQRTTEYNNLKNPAGFYSISSAPTGNFNVTTDGTPSAFWLFSGGAGNIYGEAFDNDDGDPGSIQWDDSDYNVTISGTVYEDDGITPASAPVCNGSTEVVSVVLDGTTTFRAPCDPNDGSYEITNVVYSGEPKIVAYLGSSAPTSQVNAGLADSTFGSGAIAGSSITTTRPDIADNTVLVAIIGKDDDNGTFTPPAGWTAIDTLAFATGDQMHTGAWYKAVPSASAEPATYNFGINDNGESYSWWMGALVNVDMATPLDVATTWTNYQNELSVAAPSVSTVTNGAVAIAAWYVSDDNEVNLSDTAWSTQVEDLIGSDNNSLQVQARPIATAGATGDVYANGVAIANETQAAQFVFRPAATVSATSSFTAAAVTQTPIGSAGSAYRTIEIRDQRVGAAVVPTAGTLNVNTPRVADDDVLVAILGKEDDFTITAPAGWVKAADLSSTAGNDLYSGVWYKTISNAASEPASYAFTNNDSTAEEVFYWVGSFENVDLTNVLDVTPNWNYVQNELNPIAPSITTVTDEAYVIAAWTVMYNNIVGMPGGSWDTLVDEVGISSRVMHVVGQNFSSAGATGDVAISGLGAGDDTNVGQFALRPRAAAVAEGITDLDLYRDRVIVRHEDIAPLTIADMNTIDSVQNADLPFTVATTTPNTLDIADGSGLFVWHGKTFIPDGEVILSGDGDTGADGSLTLGDLATYTSTGTDPIIVGGSFYAGAGATFDGAESLVTFTAATSGQQIGSAASSTLNFYDTAFTGVGSWAVQTPIVVDQDISVQSGIVSGVSDITVTNGDFSGNGLVDMTDGTTRVDTDNTLGGINPWSFYNLTLGDGGTTGVTTPASAATTTVRNQLRINSGHFLDALASTWDLAGTGNAFIESGGFLEGNSTVRYSGVNPTILRTAYNNLIIDTESGATTNAIAPTTGLQVFGDLTVGRLGTSTFNLNTNDPLLAVGGDVYIGALGTIQASGVSDIDAFGSWDNDGTFVANGGRVTLQQATGTATIAAGNSPFATLAVGGNANYTMVESATTTQDMSLGTGVFTLQNGEVLAVGGMFSNNMPDISTTWTGTTLRLYSGTAYTINNKTVGDTYNVIAISSSTHPRFWNSDATTVTTEAGSSLYSMDHNDVTGDLYIYGDFVNERYDDHWSYSQDWDGAVLAVPRTANVQVADTGSVLYLGGSLTTLGTTTATTTIAAQGAGPYSLTIGGTTTVDMNYYSVRDISPAGLTLTGSPQVTDLSLGDFLVTDAAGSAITLGGTVINANTARNFTGNRFATALPISAFNVTATGTAVSSWRFVNVGGNLDGESLDNDPGGDPGYIVWEDSAAIIDITGTVYENDRTTVSSVCNPLVNNIRLSIDGLTFASTTCNVVTGEYTIPNIGFGPSDTLTVYIDGEAVQAANVTRDPISLINNMDLYENHVIVRHESGAAMDIAAMAVYDSSDDADIPFTAVDAAADTLDIDPDFTLLVWDNMTFAPAGDVTIVGGASGASYDGSFELLPDATFDGAANETYNIGGDLLTGVDATFDADLSTTTFTSAFTGRIIDTNDSGFHNVSFTGAGGWIIADAEGDIGGDLAITNGIVILPAATTTVTGSFTNTGGTFDANNGTLVFDATDADNDVTFGSSDAHEVYFSGSGSWVLGDVDATTTASFIVATGTVTLPSGTLTITDDFIVNDTITHNSGVVQVVGPTGGNVVTLSGNDLNSLIIAAPGGDYTLTDASAALLGSLTITDGTFTSGTDTVSIGGSFDASGGVFNNASGTLLFNSTDSGEFIDPGTNDLYNVVISGAGGWDLVASATTTNNFSLVTAGTFGVTSGSTLYVGNVFTNDVGGPATTWTGATLFLDGQNQYETGAKTTADELYDTLVLGENTDISSWNSDAITVVVPETSSWYSQDHAGTNGQLNIYGDYHIATTTEFWSATTDFDGAVIGSRAVSVQMASGTSITVEGSGTLNIEGAAGVATTTIANQGTGTFTWITTGGTLNATQYAVTDLDLDGLQLLGNTNVSSLSGGYFTQTADNQNLITLAATALNGNAGLTIADTGFAADGFTNGVNVSLDATTTNSWTFTGLVGDLAGESFDVDGIDDCSSVRWDDSLCLLTEQANYRWRNDDGGEGAIDATWFDTNWSKRQRIRVINDDATAYASTAVKFIVEYDADMQSDFDDLRVTSADGTTLVNHWVERSQDAVEATIWLQAPTLPADTVSEFFLYYGNVTAVSVSNADAVFNLVEDFESNDLSPYNGDASLFNIGSTYAYGGSLGLDTSGNETARATDGIARNDITVSQGERIRFMQYVDTVSGATDEACTLFATQNPVTDNQNYAICVEQPGVDRISLVKDVKDTEFSGTILASSTATFSSGWYEFDIDWQTDGDIFVTMSDDNGVVIATMDANDTTYTTGGVGFTFWFQHGGWDSFLAWPRTDTLPVAYLGDEQTDGGATWANPQNTPTGGFLIGETARLRVGIENGGLPIENQNFRLEYASKLTAPSCEAVDAATFVAVPTAGAGGTPAITMVSSAFVNDGDATTDHLLTDAGDFVAGQILTNTSNQTSNYDLDQNRYTELEYAVALTVDADSDAYCFRVTNAGTVLDSYANLPELTLAFDPILDPVSINDGLDINLNAGTTTTVIASTTVTDLNGVADLVSATTTFYKTSVGAACTPNDNNCYVATSTCSFTNCAGNSCTLQCTADFAYHTDPTDLDGAEEWFAFMEVRDASNATDFGSSPGVELYTLRAMDVVNAINYGTVDINQDTGGLNPTVQLLNIGNESIDIQLAGTDMTDGVTSVIPAAQQLFATSTFNYAACLECSALTVTPANIEVDLDKPTTTSPGVSDAIYWGIEVPFGTASNPHSGLNTFTAIAD